ncbi:MAG TPA: penicillin-binding protein 2 [Solirubrobacterales bacterium]|nr:penicillin-binding protein 2 [Solirubrobacterales bacterium]
MYLRRDEVEPERRTSPLALRISILTGLAIAIFSVLFLRLWYVQVLSGDKYRTQANDNRIREIRVQAPRGDILDRNGKVLVANRTELAIQVTPQDLPPPGPERSRELKQLATVTGMTMKEIRKTLKGGSRAAPGGPVILKKGLGVDKVYYLRENQSSFPGVSVERVFTREYRQGAIAAHLFGNVGEVTAEQLKQPRYAGLHPGDQVGQSGIEYEYDRYLRGRPGMDRVQVDALGRPTGQLRSLPPEPGDDVRLTIDSNMQAVGDGALQSFGLPGAFVAMNAQNGDILAMGSAPTFDPSIFTHPITQGEYRQLTSEKTDAPLANRAIQGLYPTGSTFKPITATAALEHRLIGANTIFNDTGSLKLDDNLTLHNAGKAVYGPIDMSDALKVSSDIYFYNLGLKAKASKGHGQIQDWARKFGLGEKTGIDIPAEVEGLIPTPAWRNRLYAEKLTDRPWSAGDNVNLAIGQGDLTADPLQMAVAYAALGNGGTVLRPHLADDVESVTGRVLEEIQPAPRRQIDISPATQNTIMTGLTRAAMEPGGTSYPVFGNFPFAVAGKTGTAQRPNQADQSWYIVLAPAKNPQIVVAVTIERGGFGVDTAAPVAARMLERYFHVPITPAASASTAGQTQE